MKQVDLKNGKKVKTPWLRIDEAAAYCGISRSTFTKYAAEKLSHGGDRRIKLYDTKILDAWIRNELDIPFNPDLKLPARRRRNPKNLKDNEETTFVDPSNNKVHRIKEKQ